jgi:beta-galactosidase
MNRADDFLGVSADSNATIVVNKKDGSQVMFAVLSPEQGRHIARVSFAGRDRLIFSNASVIQDGSKLRLESENADDLKAYAYPAVPTTRTSSTSEWLFTEIPVSSVTRPKPLTVAAAQIQPATSGSAAVSGTEEAAWDSAAIYKLSVPKAAASRRVILNIHYIGDMARLYIGDKLYDDNFFNGDPFAIALWRIPKDQWANLRLKVLPATDSLLELHRLPEQAKNEITSAQAAGTVGQVTVTAADQLELKISP